MRALAIFAILLAPDAALAHGFGARIDLPIPLSLYLSAAAAAVVFSFIVMGLVSVRRMRKAEQYPRYDLLQTRVGHFLSRPAVLGSVRWLAVLVFVGIIFAGFAGSQNPSANIVPTLVWVYFSVGFVYVSALIGDVWQLLNPLKTALQPLERGLQKLRVPMLAWPVPFGVWPALIGFFIFRWVENIAPASGVPSALAGFASAYAVVTAIGVGLFGTRQWFEKGDPFSVFFRFLARFSITEYVVDESGRGRLYLRPPAVGLLKSTDASFSEMVFVLFMLASVAFDGARAIPEWQAVQDTLFGIGLPFVLIDTLGLVALLLVFLLAYLFFSWLVKFVAEVGSVRSFAKAFVFSLLPISVGYELAHFASLLLIDGQRLFALISDPLGRGWDLFGTAGASLNYEFLNLKWLWNWQVAVIVVGHIIAVWVAHLISLRYFRNNQHAMASQFPMLILMVLYTVFSLWLLAQPIIVGLE